MIDYWEMSKIGLLMVIAIGVIVLIFQNQRYKNTIKNLITHDEVTQLNNRHATVALLENQFNIARRYKHPMTLAKIKLPELSTLHLNEGRQRMNEVIRMTANIMSQEIRSTDIIGRDDFDVFLLALINTNTHDARVVIDRIVKLITSPANTNGITKCATGVTHITEFTESFNRFLEESSLALSNAEVNDDNQIEYFRHQVIR